MFFRFEIIRNKIEQKRKHTQENKSEKKEKNTKTNRKKTTKQLKFFFAIFRFCQIWFKNEKTDKNRKQKRQKIEKRKYIEFFLQQFLNFYPIWRNLTIFPAPEKGRSSSGIPSSQISQEARWLGMALSQIGWFLSESPLSPGGVRGQLVPLGCS